MWICKYWKELDSESDGHIFEFCRLQEKKCGCSGEITHCECKQELESALEDEQKYLFNEIISNAGINIVTCGDCGSINFHYLNPNITHLTCSSCLRSGDISEFPDLYY